MRVKCAAEEVPEGARAAVSLGPLFEGRRTFGVRRGTTYLVYALDVHRGIPWVHVEVEPDEVIPVPLLLFEIVDPTVPDVWEARVTEEGALLLRPAAFFAPDFSIRAYTGDPVAKAALERVRRQVAAENT